MNYTFNTKHFFSKFGPFSPPRVIPRPSGGANLGAWLYHFPGALFFFGLMASCVLTSEALAMKEDGLKAGLTALELILTGNFTRLIVICGSLWGAYQAYAKSSPMLLGGSVAIGLGINFLMSWVNSTWALTI